MKLRELRSYRVSEPLGTVCCNATPDLLRTDVVIMSVSFRNLAIGIGIQNFPEGLAVSLPLRGSGVSTWRSFWWVKTNTCSHLKLPNVTWTPGINDYNAGRSKLFRHLHLDQHLQKRRYQNANAKLTLICQTTTKTWKKSKLTLIN